MSKIGKRAILILLALPIGFNVMAQEIKKLTLEDLIPGGETYRYAENLYGLQWWGDVCIKPSTDTIYTVQPKTGKETVLTTLGQINKVLADNKAGKLPTPYSIRYPWADKPQMLLKVSGKYIVYDFENNRIVSTLKLKDKAANEDYCVANGNVAYTVNNNLYVNEQATTDKPFGVNVPLMYPEIDALMNILVEEGVKIVFTSAGNPKTWTGFLKGHGIKVAHVVSSSKFAVKCEQAGVDAIVAEGFEAGGHNGREETTTLCLIPAVRRATTLPLIAAGGIGTGNAMLATFALGAEGVQIGTRFALTEESSAHENFKQLCLNLNEGDTKLLLKKLSPTRLVKGEFTTAVEEAEARGASAEEMKELLGKGRSKKGIFEGNLQEGELEIGQVASLFREMQTVSEVMKEIMEDFRKGMEKIQLAL